MEERLEKQFKAKLKDQDSFLQLYAPYKHIKITRMQKDAFNQLELNYFFFKSRYGEALLAWHEKGISFLGFDDDRAAVWNDLNRRFPKAQFHEAGNKALIAKIEQFVTGKLNDEIALYVYGTDFQFQVWECLLRIPTGKVSNYRSIANAIESPKASRAVGSAVGSNPVSLLVPCHRVVRTDGALGGYHWGLDRKTAMLLDEFGLRA